MLTFRRAKQSDARAITPSLRREDREELIASSGLNPQLVIGRGIKLGASWAAEDSLGPIAVGGCIPLDADNSVGVPWLVASVRVHDHYIQFIRASRPWVDQIGQGYRALTNFVDARNVTHIRWLLWCGFEFVKLHPRHGAAQLPFWQFEKRLT